MFKKIKKTMESMLWNYEVFRNLSYSWNFGVLSFLCLFIQILTGLFLAMFYVSDSNEAFSSVEHIMRDVNWGWFVRYSHANGASFFFLFVYLHLFRNIYYFSYISPRWEVWVIGMLILVLMIATAFLGYVLPWGQMSFWAATVITNLFSAIPVIGNYMVNWLWGGFAVAKSTLIRFYCLHFVLPFIIFALVILHVLFLHQPGSTNPLGLKVIRDKTYFGPYYIIKDILSILVFLFIFFFIVFFYPNVLGHTDNYIPANPVVTPTHIVPEWYFLPFYAILRSIPNKFLGIVVLVISILLLFALPFRAWTKGRSKLGYILHEFFFWTFVVTCILLCWLGGQPMDYPYILLGQILTGYYIFYLGFWIGWLEKYFTDTEFYTNIVFISISEEKKKNVFRKLQYFFKKFFIIYFTNKKQKFINFLKNKK